MKNEKIYLDNAATTKPKDKVVDCIVNGLKNNWYNPSSLYTEGRNISDIITKAKKHIAYFIGARSEEIYFTSGGSESNSWAVQGFVHYWTAKGYKPVVITSTIEHKSIMACVENLCVETHFVGVDVYGNISCEQIEELLKNISHDTTKKVLVSIQHANNEIGTIQDIKKLSSIVHKYSAFFHTDGVQTIGHIPVNVNKIGIDMLSASAHKFGGLKGSGFLYIRNCVEIKPLIYGSQNSGMRGGTENVDSIVSMAIALQFCNVSKDHVNSLYDIKNKFTKAFLELPYCIQINNHDNEYLNTLPTIISVTIKERVTAEALVYLLNSSGICISSGSACNSHNEEPSYVLKAIGLSDEDAVRTIRISFDDTLNFEQINRFIAELDKAIKILIS